MSKLPANTPQVSQPLKSVNSDHNDANNEETINKRQREEVNNSENVGSSLKIRKIASDDQKNVDSIVDLTSASPQDSINLKESEEDLENKENSLGFNKSMTEFAKEQYEAETSDYDIISEKCPGRQDKITAEEIYKHLGLDSSAGMNEILSQFSDNDNDSVKDNSDHDEDRVLTQKPKSPSNISVKGLSQNKDAATDHDVVKVDDKSSPRKPEKISDNEVEKYLDINDSALVKELLSEFSDDDADSAKNDSACNNSTSLSQTTKSSSDVSSKSQLLNLDPPIQVTDADSGLVSCESHFTDGFDDLLGDWDDEKYDLDLSDLTRCKVISVDRGQRAIQLTVEDPETGEKAVVSCSGHWLQMRVSVGEFMVIKAEATPGEWIVDNNVGFCITQPDTLVAGTSVVGGLFCNRKGILQYRFKGIDSLPNIAPTDAAMTCGSVTHELLQTALKNQIYTLDGLNKKLEEILRKPYTIQMLYASGLTLKDFREMINEYVPKIYEFIDRYILGNPPEVLDAGFNGTIDSIRDVEESVWLPSLGIKGKIDVTVDAVIHNRRRIMPVEIKTGRASFAPEHKGQLYLYCMMLVILGQDVTSGLLLYIKDNLMQEIRSTHNEQRDLILLRNTMAHYLSRESVPLQKKEEDSPSKIPEWKLPELPEPIFHSRACQKCTYNTICCIYAQKDESLKLSDSHPHVKLTKKVTKDLTEEHINWVLNWVSLLHMEESFNESVAANRAIWMHKPRMRERQRTCLSYLQIDLPVVRFDEFFLHKFSRAPIENSDLSFPVENFQEVFDVNNYIMVNTDTRINVASGNAVEVTVNSITLQLQRDLTKWNINGIFHLDEFPTGILPHRILGSVAAMLADNDITRRMRRIIIDQEPATFDRPLPAAMSNDIGRKIMEPLNEYQQEALKTVIKADDYVLIKGMPGTGKTQTLVALIKMLIHLGSSVLITAHTHMAVDNVLMKLNEDNIDFLRLGSRFRFNEALDHKTDFRLLQECETPEKLEALYLKKNVVAVTCLGAHHILLSKRIFDYCLVDECTQALQPILLRPLFNARKFVLVGDPEQLPAVVKCSEARRLGMDEDMFSRLDNENNTRILKLQYRMNETIMNLANRLTYRGELMAGNDKIANATLQWKNPQALESCERWVRNVLSPDLNHAVVMLNTKATFSMNVNVTVNRKALDGDNEPVRCSNVMEAVIIREILKVLLAAGIKPQDIGVIAPFKAQIILLKRILPDGVEINTVDQYQGRDKSVILFSCTRSVPTEFKRQILDYEILADHKRLNVAMTRAKHKLIIVGDLTSLQRFTPFGKLFEILDHEIIDLTPGCDDFSWQNLRETMKGTRFEGLFAQNMFFSQV